jgi:hypothetical protein
MAIPITGMKMEKITAGIPNIEAAAGEVNADSITWVCPLLCNLTDRFRGWKPLPHRDVDINTWDPASREIYQQVYQ